MLLIRHARPKTIYTKMKLITENNKSNNQRFQGVIRYSIYGILYIYIRKTLKINSQNIVIYSESKICFIRGTFFYLKYY